MKLHSSQAEEIAPVRLAVSPHKIGPRARAVPASSDSASLPAADRGAARDSDFVFHLYLREVGRIPLLTRAEEYDLARRVQRGDEAAREQMIQANLRLVVKIAREYEDFGLPLLDLISEGNIGLMKAVERYDPDRGCKLSSYAAFWIKQAIRRALANQGKTIRLPVHAQEKLLHINRAISRLQAQLGHEPSDEEVAEEVGLPADKVRRLRSAALRPVSLDAAVDEEGSKTMSEMVADESARAPDANLDTGGDLDLLQQALQGLKPREVTVLSQRFGLTGQPGKTLEEVSHQFGLTRERVRQIQNAALRKLREIMAERDAMQLAV